ncbi:unnamed protein product [Urochloa humidicola]
MVVCLLPLSKFPTESFRRWPFPNSSARRCYLEARVTPGDGMKPIHVATAHLESPAPPSAMRCVERAAQAEHAVSAMNREENVVFGGDMSWDDKVDLSFPLPDGWVDAWTKLRPSDSYYTYDDMWTRDPRMANLRNWAAPRIVAPHEEATTQRRSDRFVCKLRDYQLKGIDLIGTGEQENRCMFTGLRFRSDRNEMVDFLPSSHFGVVLTLAPKKQEH